MNFILALAAVSTALALPLQRRAQASTDLCGDYDYIILSDTPWIVYNMLYNADETVGTQCTYYDSQTTAASGTREVIWSSITEITYEESTDNVPKGYSFVGLTENLETRLSDISSIPTVYEWTRTNSTAFKGNVCYDFMTNDVAGDSTSSSSHELMLWLQYEGGQLPIGWADGAVDTIDDLFGTSWKLYSGVNDDTGITVSSLLPDTQFDGDFGGDLRDWLMALVDIGLFDETTYVNVGNGGTEFFYGNAVMNATFALEIELGTATTVATASVNSVTAAAAATATTAVRTSSTLDNTSATLRSSTMPSQSASPSAWRQGDEDGDDDCY
ncbi:hypothetical protein ASPZODRAFT_76599 [Penicilliopsis zonata CBS 506.65]|uniref:xyloglucan-specific endo-beta-1,4-glucanase n=1 Tax=Penicilliopsis zonata CBS 506.65 TaxID=1073090 RepID=A0A1L9S618_9EURO|nr:hypothetical protein ASPZODRAFT_76599 [Penicilliopsis zonata CBS 506.65]OJJ42617.1 hypothetical protein ASPZODRAFT_76599 [Penicilliopsis zonata CBS 506.65]